MELRLFAVLAVTLYSVMVERGVQASTCTLITDFTCPATMFSTGMCGMDGNCECDTGYSPDQYGCRQDLERPVVTISDSDVLPYGINSDDFILTCNPNDKGSGNYEWFINGQLIMNQLSSTYSVQTVFVNSSRNYTCWYYEDRFSEESEPFELSTAHLSNIDLNDPSIQPRITGMPTVLINGTLLTLTCSNYMLYDTLFRWSSDVHSTTTSSNPSTTVQVLDNFSNLNISCIVDLVQDSTMTLLHATETFPDLSDNIPGVHVEGREQRYINTNNIISLTCAFDVEDFVSTGLDISWTWYFNNNSRPETTQTISLGPLDLSFKGEWRCAAQLGTNMMQESLSVFLNVGFTFSVTVTSFPTIPIEDGYLEIRCEVILPDDDFKLEWFKDGSLLHGYTDSTIYINNLDSSVSDTYTCYIDFDKVETSTDIDIPDPIAFTMFPPPTLSVNNTSDDFVFDEIYQLTCEITDTDTRTPGTQLIFLEDGSPFTDGTDESILITGNVTDKTFTCIGLFNSSTTSPSNAINVSFPVIKSVMINDINDANITDMDAVVNTLVTLKCVVNLEPGVSTDVNSVLWYEDSMELGETDLTLVVNVSGNHLYSCEAEVGSHSLRSSTVALTAHKLTSPVLSMVDNAITQNLDFQQPYQLHCNASSLADLFDVTYTFLRDGHEVVTSSSSQMYTITNDLQDREYTCVVLHQTLSSDPSNVISPRFDVFNQTAIHDLNGDVITSMDGIINASVTLTSFVSLHPGIPGQPTITWYDQTQTEVGTGSTLVVSVTEEDDLFYYFNASLGIYWMRSSNNVTIIPHELTSPVLSMVDNAITQNLDFVQPYQLHCNASSLADLFDVSYTFLRDDQEVVTSSASQMYTITNDLEDREYTCVVLHQTLTSDPSNVISPRFDVFNQTAILDLNGDVITSTNGIINATVTLTSSVSFQPGISDQPTITWYDQGQKEVGTGSNLVVSVSDEDDVFYYFNASLGIYWMRSSNNVTIIPHELIAPVLILNNNISGDGLNFSESYTLHCDVGAVLSTFGLDYEYSSQDGTVSHTDTNATYTISNDVNDIEYTCKASFLNVTSPTSNSVFTSFEVLGGLNVTLGSVTCHVRSSTDPMYRTNLMCDATLMPDVTDDVTYTWYDLRDNTTMTSETLTIFVQGNVSLSFICQAQIGSHADNVSHSYQASASVLSQTIPCCAHSLHLHLSLTLVLLSVISFAFCHCKS